MDRKEKHHMDTPSSLELWYGYFSGQFSYRRSDSTITQLVACMTADPVVVGLIGFPAWPHNVREDGHEIISTVILPFPLIQEGQLSIVWEKYVHRCWLTHCILNRLSHTIYWKSPISILGTASYEIYIFLEKKGSTICKQWRPWSDATFWGIWSGSALFANYPFMSPDYNGVTS